MRPPPCTRLGLTTGLPPDRQVLTVSSVPDVQLRLTSDSIADEILPQTRAWCVAGRLCTPRLGEVIGDVS